MGTQRRDVSGLSICQSPHGRSVVADRLFVRGEFILEFRGRSHSRTDYLRALRPQNCHFLQVGPDTFLGPSRSPGDYVNHCCRPNSGVKLSDGRARLFAIRRIRPGEEILFDYSTTMAEDHWEMDCTCGVRGCRGRIRDFRYLPPVLRGRYIEMGIVPRFVFESLPQPVGAPNAEPAVPISA